MREVIEIDKSVQFAIAKVLPLEDLSIDTMLEAIAPEVFFRRPSLCGHTDSSRRARPKGGMASFVAQCMELIQATYGKVQRRLLQESENE